MGSRNRKETERRSSNEVQKEADASGNLDVSGRPLEETGLSAAQYKRLVAIFWEDVDYKQLETPEELHQFVWNYNWDDGIEPLRWVINHHNCDRGTALMVYWHGGPGWDCQYESREDVNEYELEGYDLLREIEQKYLSGSYTRQSISFDPTEDEGTNWTKEYEEYETKKQIPREIYVPVHGRKLERAAI